MTENEQIKTGIICVLGILKNLLLEIEKNPKISLAGCAYIEKTVEILDKRGE